MAAGLFLAGLAVHYAAGAKRLVPEALALYSRIFQAAAPAGALLRSAQQQRALFGVVLVQ